MDGIAASKIISDEKLAPVLLLTAFSQPEIVERAKESGVLAYLVKPVRENNLFPAMEIALSRFQEMQQLEGELDKLKGSLEMRKTLDRAKGILMDELGYKEQEAFTFIQRTAMSERTRMRDVADRILDGSLRPDAG